MMFRKEVFEAVGGFDTERLEDTFGDVDLCLRMGEQGYLIVYTPYAEFVWHDPRPVSGLKREQAGYVRERWKEALSNDPYHNPNLRWAVSALRPMPELVGFGKRPAVATRRARAAKQ